MASSKKTNINTTKEQERAELHRAIWQIANDLRGSVDGWDFKKEFNNNGIDVDLKVIIDSKIKSKIHDRWIISNTKSFNLPSTNTIVSGQYSEIKETNSEVPFDQWWDSSLDIIKDWQKIDDLMK